jgi:hypothetical protein
MQRRRAAHASVKSMNPKWLPIRRLPILQPSRTLFHRRLLCDVLNAIPQTWAGFMAGCIASIARF